MNEQAEVTKLKKKDLDELLLIAKVYFGVEPWLTKEYLLSLEKTALVKLVIRLQGRIIGGAIVSAGKQPNVFLDFMVIDNNFSRQGLGENLFVTIERSLEAGLKLWYLAQDNKKFLPARKFLLKMGMEQNGHLHGFYGDVDAVGYSKKIR